MLTGQDHLTGYLLKQRPKVCYTTRYTIPDASALHLYSCCRPAVQVCRWEYRHTWHTPCGVQLQHFYLEMVFIESGQDLDTARSCCYSDIIHRSEASNASCLRLRQSAVNDTGANPSDALIAGVWRCCNQALIGD